MINVDQIFIYKGEIYPPCQMLRFDGLHDHIGNFCNFFKLSSIGMAAILNFLFLKRKFSIRKMATTFFEDKIYKTSQKKWFRNKHPTWTQLHMLQDYIAYHRIFQFSFLTVHPHKWYCARKLCLHTHVYNTNKQWESSSGKKQRHMNRIFFFSFCFFQ